MGAPQSDEGQFLPILDPATGKFAASTDFE